MEDDRRSVRIEVGSEAAPQGQASGGNQPNAPVGAGRRAMLGAATVMVVAVLAALVALQPDTGETAAGTTRQAFTTTQLEVAGSSSSTGEATSTTTTISTGATVEGFEDFTFISDVVRAPVGFLALSDGPSDGLAPRLWRSLDGREWEAVAVGVEAPAELAEREQLFAFFTGLERQDDGYGLFAVLEVLEVLDSGVDQIQREVVRLVSEQGDQWVVDASFDGSDAVNVVPFPAGGGVVALFEFSEGRGVFQQVVEQYIPSAIGEQACFAELRSEQLTLYLCDSGGSRVVTAEDVTDQERFFEIFRCIAALAQSELASPIGGLRFVGRGGDDRGAVAFERTPLAVPVVLADGTIMAMAAAAQGGIDSPACDRLDVPFPDAQPAELFVWEDLDSEPVIHELPDDVAKGVAATFFNTRPRALGDGMLLAVGAEIWHLAKDGALRLVVEGPDIESNPWEQLLGISEDGRTVARVRPTVIELWTVDLDGEVVDQRSMDIRVSLSVGGRVHCVDESALLASFGERMVFFDLGEAS